MSTDRQVEFHEHLARALHRGIPIEDRKKLVLQYVERAVKVILPPRDSLQVVESLRASGEPLRAVFEAVFEATEHVYLESIKAGADRS